MSIELGLIGTGLGLGLRHGIDWDHIAAITDVTGTQPERVKALRLGTLYAFGHASVVVILGLVALWVGSTLPESINAPMESVVGVTLIALGIWLVYSLCRDGTSYRMRSRWMLLFDTARRAGQWLSGKFTDRAQAHTYTSRARGTYGVGAAYGIGMLHGVGAETGSQVFLFTAATSAASNSNLSGSLLLLMFVVGLLISNSLITFGSVLGFSGSHAHRIAYVGLGTATAVFSLVVGTVLLLAQGSLLPSILM